MFLAWAIINHLEGELHQEEFEDYLVALRQREMTGREFLFKACDEKFTDKDLNEEGNAFAAAYYEKGGYSSDLQATFPKLSSLYHLADTWKNYDMIAPVISRRFAEWKRGRS